MLPRAQWQALSSHGAIKQQTVMRVADAVQGYGCKGQFLVSALNVLESDFLFHFYFQDCG